MEKHKVDDHCIRHEGRYKNVGVYVVVVMDGAGCPVDVQVSLAFHNPAESERLRVTTQRDFDDFAGISRDWIHIGWDVCDLIRFLKKPPCETSGIIGDALIAALEGGGDDR